MKHLFLLSMLFLTACASTDEFAEMEENEADLLHKQIRQLKRERDAAREDYDADVSRAFHRDQLDRRFPYTGMPGPTDWQVQRSKEADREEEEARQKAAVRYYNQTNTVEQVSTPYGFFPVQAEKRPTDSSCKARPVYDMHGRVRGYKRVCEGFDH